MILMVRETQKNNPLESHEFTMQTSRQMILQAMGKADSLKFGSVRHAVFQLGVSSQIRQVYLQTKMNRL